MNSFWLDFSYITAITLEIGIPIIIAFYIRKKYGASWSIFFLGLFFFLLSLVRIPLNSFVNNTFSTMFFGDRFILFSAAFASLTAGLFEEGVRVLAFGLVLKRSRNFGTGLMYGIGHGGGGESMMFVGLMLLANFLIYKFFPLIISGNVLNQMAGLAWYTPLIGALERLFAIVIQISLSLMVLYSFMSKKYIFIFLAVFYHFIIDFTVVYLQNKIGFFFIELIVFAFSAIGVLIIFLLKPKIKILEENSSLDH